MGSELWAKGAIGFIYKGMRHSQDLIRMTIGKILDQIVRKGGLHEEVFLF